MTNRPLVSWLVATSIVASATALLLPGAESTIEAARRARCVSNQRTISTYAALLQVNSGRQRVRVSDIVDAFGVDGTNLRCPNAPEGTAPDASYAITDQGACVTCRVEPAHGASGPGCPR